MTPREVLKLAAAHNAGKALGAALRLAGKGAKAVVGGAASLGGGIAEGAGVAPELGQLVGGGGAILAGANAAGKAKNKVDEWRYRHGLYRSNY